MAELSIPVLVSVSAREIYEVALPRTGDRWRGPSLATLLDDVALALMERLPKEQPERMPLYESCPHVELRKVKVEVRTGGGAAAPGRGSRERAAKDEERPLWKGRVSVVVSRWPEDRFAVATIPRLSPEVFAVSTPAALERSVTAFLEAWSEKHGALDHAACDDREFLEILHFEADHPSPLPSQPLRRPSRKRKKKLDPNKPAEPAPPKKNLPPVTLRAVARNLTTAALDGRLHRAHAREPLIVQLLAELSGDSAALLLVGPSGAGKTAIVHELVHRLSARSSGLHDRTDVWQVDGNRLIAGMSVVGAWEQRLADMVHELMARQDVLYVEDLPVLAFTGRTAHGDSNVAELLSPHLERRELRVIGECTEERLAAVRDEAPGFFEHFRVVYVPELDEGTTLEVLAQIARHAVPSDEATVELETLEGVLSLTRRFQGAQALPGRATAVLASLLDERAPEDAPRDELGRRRIGLAELIAHYGRRSGLPRFVLWEREAREHAQIEAYFARRIVAQPQAVEAAVDVVTLLEQGLNDPGRPLSTFLFVGPTGVGKTETAKALAELLFGSTDRLVRFDMSEFQDLGSVTRLFGDRASPSGELTRRVEHQPFSVVLLDEIEKAHPAVFDALLGVLGEGRLTNALGRTIDFTSTIIVMTSNLGVREAGRRTGFAGDRQAEAEATHLDAARRFFRPEMYNRIDRVVSFRALDRGALDPLVRRLLAGMLGRRGLQRSSVLVDVEPELVETLIDRGFDPRYGARSIRRELEQRLALPLAEHLVAHHGAPLTLATLGAAGDDVKLSLSWPAPVLRAALVLPPIASWSALEGRLQALVDALHRLEHDPDLVAIQRERTILLASHNRGDLTGEGQAALDAWSTILAEREAILREAGELHGRAVEVEAFEEEVVELITEVRSWHSRQPFKKGPEVRLTREGRGVLRPEVVEALVAIELRFAGLVRQVRVSRGPRERSALVRFTPFDEASRPWALELAQAWAEAWDGRGTATVLGRRGGRWSALATPPSADEARELSALAVELVGPGALGWAAEELGWVLDVVERGADKHSALVAIEEVGDGTEAAAWLGSLPSGRAELPLRRHLVNGRLEDGETGVRLARSGLARALREIDLRRVYARFLEEGSS